MLSTKIVDICQLVWLTKNTSYENVGGIFLGSTISGVDIEISLSIPISDFCF